MVIPLPVYFYRTKVCTQVVSLQAYSDLQPFTDLYRHPPGTAIDLTSAPVILHLQHDLSLLDLVNAAGRSMENCDFKKVCTNLS